MDTKSIKTLLSITLSAATLLFPKVADVKAEQQNSIATIESSVTKEHFAEPSEGIGRMMQESSDKPATDDIVETALVEENVFVEAISFAEEVTTAQKTAIYEEEARKESKANNILFKDLSLYEMELLGYGGAETIIRNDVINTDVYGNIIYDENGDISGTIHIENGKTFSYEDRFAANITAYCPCSACCDNSTWKTYTGVELWKLKEPPRIVAAGYSFPAGTILFIPGIGEVVVEDRGGAIDGLDLDILILDHDIANKFGRTECFENVYVLYKPDPNTAFSYDEFNTLIVNGNWSLTIEEFRKMKFSEWALSINPTE